MAKSILYMLMGEERPLFARLGADPIDLALDGFSRLPGSRTCASDCPHER
jgi:hypothetical protein